MLVLPHMDNITPMMECSNWREQIRNMSGECLESLGPFAPKHTIMTLKLKLSVFLPTGHEVVCNWTSLARFA